MSTTALDAEVSMLIDSALFDMERAGVNPALLAVDDESGDLPNMFVKQAVTCWCKANFGYDVSEAYRFEAAYDRILNALLNSANNIAAMEEAEGGEAVDQPELGSVQEGDEGTDGAQDQEPLDGGE